MILSIYPVTGKEKQLHNMMLPPPFFTVLWHGARWVLFCDKVLFKKYAQKILVESDHKTFHEFMNLANCRWAWMFFSVFVGLGGG